MNKQTLPFWIKWAAIIGAAFFALIILINAVIGAFHLDADSPWVTAFSIVAFLAASVGIFLLIKQDQRGPKKNETLKQ